MEKLRASKRAAHKNLAKTLLMSISIYISRRVHQPGVVKLIEVQPDDGMPPSNVGFI